MLIHDFILVSEVPEEISYANYTKEEMTQISDEFVQKYFKVTERVEMFFNDLNSKDTGLNYHGTTILDNKMAEELKTVLIAECEPCDDLTKLVTVLNKAVSENKYIIHFGI